MKLSIPTVWGGQLSAKLFKTNDSSSNCLTTKIIGVHGWLDNLNSLLPLVEKLKKQNYEICLYDRAGHGYSSHLPKAIEYDIGNNMRDLRTVVQNLGWSGEKFIFIGHSYGAILALTYAAIYRDEVQCVVAIDALPSITLRSTEDSNWASVSKRIDQNIEYYNHPPKVYDTQLTFDKAFQVVKSMRLGISDEAAKLLTERSIKTDADGNIHLTRDKSLNLRPMIPFHGESIIQALKRINVPILYIQATQAQWPEPKESIQLLKQCNPNFEMEKIDGPHHLHMTHVDRVSESVEKFIHKYVNRTEETAKL